MTFARGLRAILRQDPDVVMVGEIRDLETAEIAVQASLTGHLVMSTLHTNTAVGAVNRLIDMGVEPFLLSSSLVGVLAQRLVRVLCPDCKAPREANRTELQFLGMQSAQVFDAPGCEHCGHGGFRGRTGVYELVLIRRNHASADPRPRLRAGVGRARGAKKRPASETTARQRCSRASPACRKCCA